MSAIVVDSAFGSSPVHPNPSRLTAREDQVLGLIGLGLTNREIGGRLGIAEKTVKNTVTVVLAKLGMQRRTQAVIYVTVRSIAADQAAAEQRRRSATH